MQDNWPYGRMGFVAVAISPSDNFLRWNFWIWMLLYIGKTLFVFKNWCINNMVRIRMKYRTTKPIWLFILNFFSLTIIFGNDTLFSVQFPFRIIIYMFSFQKLQNHLPIDKFRLLILTACKFRLFIVGSMPIEKFRLIQGPPSHLGKSQYILTDSSWSRKKTSHLIGK